MGNCCGKAKAKAPPASNTGRSAAASKFGGPGRTLGAGPSGPSQNSAPGEAAAQAAEARLSSPKLQGKPGKPGKLGKQLEEQRKQTHNQTLTQAARDNLAARTADANADARAYN